jgi:long-chain fatty acid transport protein
MMFDTTSARTTILAGTLFILGGFSGTAQASGFALIEQSVSAMGNAYAIGSAGIDDASTIYFNPAGMTRLPGGQLSGAVHIVDSNVDFTGEGFYNPSNPAIKFGGLGGQFYGGDGHVDVGLTKAIPNFYVSYEYKPDIWFGLGVNVPFGLETDYEGDWVGRYHSIKSDLLTVNINPSVAFRIGEHASLGIGVSAMYADATLTQAIDFGLLGVLQGVPGFGPADLGNVDGKAKIKGDDWGFGANLGLLLEPAPGTRLGIHYRSPVNLNLDGNATFDVPDKAQPIAQATGAFVRTGDGANISLPATLSISAYHEFSPRLALMGDITWTQWSTFQNLVIEFDNPAQSDSITPLNWKDILRYSVGASYRYNKAWILRGGLAYDKTPIPNADLRTPRVPGNSRTWLAVGAGYHYSDTLSFDVGYAHLFVDDTRITSADAHSPTLSPGAHKLNGKYDASVNILSAQVNWKFR